MIRRAEAGDRGALEAIYEVCFPGEPQFRQWFFDRVWQPEHTLLWQESGGHILSDVMAIPIAMTLGGREYPAHYIYAAGTLPQARGRGLMGRLLGHACQTGAAAGQWFSVLITQDASLFDFYGPLGYTTLSKLCQLEAREAPLPPGHALRPAVTGDYEALAALYRAEMADRLVPVRGPEHFAHMLELYGQDFVVLEGSSGEVLAYGFLEAGDGRPFIKEAVGPGRQTLAQALCNRLGRPLVFQAVGACGGHGLPNGCIKPLTPAAQELLAGLKEPPYINLMYN